MQRFAAVAGVRRPLHSGTKPSTFQPPLGPLGLLAFVIVGVLPGLTANAARAVEPEAGDGPARA
jgi:hypothetical protein